MANDYREFLERKTQLGGKHGFKPNWLPDFLFGFQKSLVEWATERGRAAMFADCGLGKSIMQLVWAENVVRHTNGRVLILTPLAVGPQTVREADKFGVGPVCLTSSDARERCRIHVANYERLHTLDANDYVGVVCDESSILKNFDGRRRKDITEFLRKRPYRLLCTATAAPNDYVELGTSSEAIGELGNQDMLARFFKHDDDTIFLHGTKHGDFSQNKWRFKAHAEKSFWRWVCSWARAMRKPSDLGFDDSGFILPPLKMVEHEVQAVTVRSGVLFEMPATTLAEQREEQKRTIVERCEKVSELVSSTRKPAVCWCHLNEEGDRLESLIRDSVQISGSDSEEKKEEAFAAFANGEIRVIITKPKVGGFGLNWQHCSHQTFFPSHSFEQFYQSVRRSWRFGQKKPVRVDLVVTDGSAGVMANLQRKSEAAERMFAELVRNMADQLLIGSSDYGDTKLEVPSWL